MTEAELGAVKARAEAATPGPWVVGEHYGGVIAPGSSLDPENDAAYGGYLVGESMLRHNSTFVAHARDDVPALVAEVERLTAHLERIRNLDDAWTLEGARGIAFRALRGAQP